MQMATPIPRPRSELDAELRAAMESESARQFSLCLRMMGNEADARDVLQDAWLRAWRNREAWRGEGPAPAWLRAILVRECLRSLRWRSVRRWLPFGAQVPDTASPAANPEAALDAERVACLVAELPSQQRVAWGLRFSEGWSVPEIAAALELSPETVKTHLARALERVRAGLGVRDEL